MDKEPKPNTDLKSEPKPEASEAVSLPNLRTMEFKMPRLATVDEPQINEVENIKVTFNGIPLDLHIEKYSSFSLTTIDISASRNTEIYFANISVNFAKVKDGTFKATTSISNYNREIPGLGRALWEVSLQFMQKFANELNTSVMHKVSRKPDSGLGYEKWAELFLPLLSKHGYLQKYEDLWEKTYLSHKE